MTSEAFIDCLRACRIPPGARVLAAVSGGADSVCLLHWLCQARDAYPLTVYCAHAEHGIRGDASLADQTFVRGLCEAWGVPFVTGSLHVPEAARERGEGLEACARTLRYAFLREQKRSLNCEVILTAHHAGDQAETVLMRACRGTDIRGLCAMALRSGDLARPLLGYAPGALREALRSEGIPWREDESNEDCRYARNHLRNRVLPEMKKVAPQTEAALGRLARAAQRDEDFFARQLDALGLTPHRLIDGAALPRAGLDELHEALLGRAVVRLLEAAGVDPDAECVEAAIEGYKRIPQGARGQLANLSGDGKLILERNWLCAVFPEKRIEAISLREGETQTPFGRFTLRPAEAAQWRESSPFCQALPALNVNSLSVGPLRLGETMIPFGRQGAKKINGILCDAGVSPSLRRSIPVVRYHDEALWIPGVRAAEGCRVREHAAYMITYEPCDSQINRPLSRRKGVDNE